MLERLRRFLMPARTEPSPSRADGASETAALVQRIRDDEQRSATKARRRESVREIEDAVRQWGWWRPGGDDRHF